MSRLECFVQKTMRDHGYMAYTKTLNAVLDKDDRDCSELGSIRQIESHSQKLSFAVTLVR